MVVLLTCNNKEYPIKNEGARVFTTLYIDFSDAQGQITRSGWWYLAKIGTHPSFHACPRYLPYEVDSYKNEGARVVTRFLPL